MNIEFDEQWRQIARALFGWHKTSDEGLFTLRVMEQVRLLQRSLWESAWPRFWHWTLPALGAGLASLILAFRVPMAATPDWMDAVLFQHQAAEQDPLAGALEDVR